jgi:hypothetical protein
MFLDLPELEVMEVRVADDFEQPWRLPEPHVKRSAAVIFNGAMRREACRGLAANLATRPPPCLAAEQPARSILCS